MLCTPGPGGGYWTRSASLGIIFVVKGGHQPQMAGVDLDAGQQDELMTDDG